ncbi:MAG: hypothetical protein HY301_18715 [Verrucomicrobia bacterium]|nr:hypothetical protein [Verrucomicrobiota bacterium]
MSTSETNAPPVLVPAPRRRSGGLWWKVLLGLFGCGVLLLVILALSLGNIARRVVRTQIERVTGMPTEIDSLKLSLRPLGIRIAGFRMMNTPEFGGTEFLNLPELAVSVDREPSTNGQSKLQELRINLARVNVVVDQKGRSNLDALQERGEAERKRQSLKRGTNAPPAADAKEMPPIARLELSLGELHFDDQRDPNATKTLRFRWTNEVMTNVVSRDDLGGRLLVLAVTRGATMQGEKLNDPYSLLELIGKLLKPSGN